MAEGLEEGSSESQNRCDRQHCCPPALAASAGVPVIKQTEPHLSAKDGLSRCPVNSTACCWMQSWIHSQMKANSPTVLTVKEITCLETNQMYTWFYSSFPQHTWLLEILSCAQSFLFLFIYPYSKLTAGFTYENQLTDALQDIKHIYDKSPDKSLYVPYLSCKTGEGGSGEGEKTCFRMMS